VSEPWLSYPILDHAIEKFSMPIDTNDDMTLTENIDGYRPHLSSFLDHPNFL